MEHISATDFIRAFREEWAEQIKEGKKENEIISNYREDKKWTNFMLGDKSLLKNVSCNLSHEIVGLRYWRELYTIDAVYVSSKDQLDRKDLFHPEIHIGLEHENGDYPEEELWKLAYWRIPLKVIIFYDYNEDDKEKAENKKGWLSKKIGEFNSILNRIEGFWSERESTEYLLLVGNKPSAEELPTWRVSYRQPGQSFSDLSGLDNWGKE